MDNQFKLWITDGMKKISVDISNNQIEKFYRYYELLIEWNQVMNLTAITDMEQVVYKHFIDSVSLIKAVDVSRETSRRVSLSCIDVGTGAGFPGIPLKIMFSDMQITLIDSLNKRIRFLNEVIETLNLDNITAKHGRAEDLGRNTEYREKYDICVSRAVANLATLSEYCLPFVKTGGCFISYKSGHIEEEMKLANPAVNLLGGTIEKVENFTLPGTDADRSLIVIRKKSKTPCKYPRKAGLPGKEPIGLS